MGGPALAVTGRQQAVGLMKNPFLAVVVLRILESLARAWMQRRRYVLDRQLVQERLCDRVDSELLQGCLLSTEHLLTLGRVEKRTLWSRPLTEVLGGNQHLCAELLRAAETCRAQSRNCMVMRWMPADERYHVMQASLNSMSSIFGPSMVHFNAADGDATGTFRQTWYCLTVMTPTRRDLGAEGAEGGQDGAPIPDGSRVPRATLRVMLVNETELRRVADRKLVPPAWGFFNNRHEERYRMLVDFATNFQMQLVKATKSGSQADTRGGAGLAIGEGAQGRRASRPDGGLMKRVQSVPDMKPGQQQGHMHHGSSTNLNAMGGTSSTNLQQFSRVGGAVGGAPPPEEPPEESGAAEENCFLRLHIPLQAPPIAPSRRDTPHEDRGDPGERTLGLRPRLPSHQR